ncbi:MAG: hypothetical protein WD359_06330 [Dehalococcoidia bacterium]
MTTEHAPSTNGRAHTSDTKSDEPGEIEAPPAAEKQSGVASRLVMPLLLVAVAFVVLRRLNHGGAVS